MERYETNEAETVIIELARQLRDAQAAQDEKGVGE